jgi:tetratricopeptide (TPR) repeat protein
VRWQAKRDTAFDSAGQVHQKSGVALRLPPHSKKAARLVNDSNNGKDPRSLSTLICLPPFESYLQEGDMFGSIRVVVLAMAVISLLASVTLAQSSQSEARNLINRGNEKYQKAEYEAAIEIYSQIHAGSGELYARALYNIGVCYYELYRNDDAIVMYEKAIQASESGYPRASYALGVALQDQGRSAEAKNAYRRAIETGNDSVPLAYYKLGVMAANESDWKTAEKLFKKAIAQSKEPFPSSHNNLGVALARGGKLAEAEREFDIALQLANGSHAEAQHNLELCRALRASRTTGTLIGSLRMKEDNPWQSRETMPSQSSSFTKSEPNH